MELLRWLTTLMLGYLWMAPERTIAPLRCAFYELQSVDPHLFQREDLVKIRVQKSVPNQTVGREQLIPYHIHQTNELDDIPADMALAIESLVQKNPEYSYHYYNGTQRRQFVRQHMGSTVLACYDKLVPNAYKADLFRYSVVYTFGGCYTDVGTIFLDHYRNTILPDDTFVSTQDGFLPHVEVNSAFFCATAKHPILDNAIRTIVRRVANSVKGDDMLDVTGPWLLRKGFEQYFEQENMEIVPKVYAKGIRLIEQRLNPACKVNQIGDQFRDVNLIHQKYPRYTEDMLVYSNQPHYSAYFNNNTVFNESVVVKSDSNYSVEPIP